MSTPPGNQPPADEPTRVSRQVTLLVVLAVAIAIGLTATGVTIPEPVTLVLLIGAIVSVAVIGARERRSHRALLQVIDAEAQALGLTRASGREAQPTPSTAAGTSPAPASEPDATLPGALRKDLLGKARSRRVRRYRQGASDGAGPRTILVTLEQVKRGETSQELHLLVVTATEADGTLRVTTRPEPLGSVLRRRPKPSSPVGQTQPFETTHEVQGDAILTERVLDPATKATWHEHFAFATVAVSERWVGAARRVAKDLTTVSDEEAAQALRGLVAGVEELADRLDEGWSTPHPKEGMS